MKLYNLDNELLNSNTVNIPTEFTGIVEFDNNTDVGTKFWYKEGKLHRSDGPAVIRPNLNSCQGSETWYFENKKHREDGPAVTYSDGRQEWWLNEQLHRLDGPAVVYANGTKEYRISGDYVEEEDFDESVYLFNKGEWY